MLFRFRLVHVDRAAEFLNQPLHQPLVRVLHMDAAIVVVVVSSITSGDDERTFAINDSSQIDEIVFLHFTRPFRLLNRVGLTTVLSRNSARVPPF